MTYVDSFLFWDYSKCTNTVSTLFEWSEIMIIIDYRDKRPIYEQIYEKLSNLIVTGALKENEKIPSVRNLAIDLSINPNTIQRAYALLEQNGYIYTVKGRGNFVSEKSAYLADEKRDVLTEIKIQVERAKNLSIDLGEVESIISEIYK